MDALLPNGPHPARLERVQSMLRARFSRSRAPPPLYALLLQKQKFLPLSVFAIVSLTTFRLTLIIHILAWVLRLVLRLVSATASATTDARRRLRTMYRDDENRLKF